jgi:hypothetical protein
MRFFVARKRPRARTIAIVLANSILAFVVCNVLLWGWYAWSDARELRLVGSRRSNTLEPAGLKLEDYFPNKERLAELTNETYQPFQYQPFVEFRERPRSGNYVNVDSAGFRVSSAQSKWPPDPERPAIFVFGGSTTFGYGVADDETVVSALSTVLRRDARFHEAQLYNFGRGFYWSTQEHILFSTMVLSGPKPNMAIFIDGLNEFYYSSQRPVFAADMEEAFEREGAARRNVRGKFSALWYDTRQLLLLLPIFRFTGAQDSRPPRQGGPRLDPYNPESVHAAIDNYFINKAMIKSIGALNHIETLFVWQPIPTYQYPSHLHRFYELFGYGPHSQSFYGYPQMKARNESRKDDDFVWCADVYKDAERPLYVDLVHYNPRGAALLADCIAQAVLARQTSPRATR